jgi:hypothetical protein
MCCFLQRSTTQNLLVSFGKFPVTPISAKARDKVCKFIFVLWIGNFAVFGVWAIPTYWRKV